MKTHLFFFFFTSLIFVNSVDSAKAKKIPPTVRHHALLQKQVGFYAVYLPNNYKVDHAKGKKYPLCVILHGSGSTEIGHGNLALPYSAEDIIFVAPRAPYPEYEVFMDTHAEGWTAWPNYPSEWGSFFDKEFPHQELAGLDLAQMNADWIADCIRDMRRRYPIEPGKATVIGHSEGAAFAHITAARHPDLIKAYAAYGGYYPFLDDSTAAHSLRSGNVFSEVIHCEADSQVSVAESRKLIKYLSDYTLPHSDTIFSGGNHQIGSRPTAALRDFIFKWCLGRKAPHLKGLLIIDTVIPGSRADSLGLQAGDCVKTYGGKKIKNLDDYNEARKGVKDIDSVVVEILRATKRLVFKTQTGTLGINLGER